MSSVCIDNDRCDRSPMCPARRICPKNAIAPAPGGPYPGANGYIVNEELCAACGACVRVCAGGAVTPC